MIGECVVVLVAGVAENVGLAMDAEALDRRRQRRRAVLAATD